MAFIKMVGNRMALYPGLTKPDNTVPVMGEDVKAGADYMYLEFPLHSRRKTVKAGELIELTTNIKSTPHRCHVMVIPNRALALAGEISGAPTMIEVGESADLSFFFRPREDFNLTALNFLLRIYVHE